MGHVGFIVSHEFGFFGQFWALPGNVWSDRGCFFPFPKAIDLKLIVPLLKLVTRFISAVASDSVSSFAQLGAYS